jgi:hypothetical protein
LLQIDTRRLPGLAAVQRGPNKVRPSCWSGFSNLQAATLNDSLRSLKCPVGLGTLGTTFVERLAVFQAADLRMRRLRLEGEVEAMDLIVLAAAKRASCSRCRIEMARAWPRAGFV